MRRRPLRVAMIGCRGVPAAYGGIERHVEEVGARLVARGHRVTVYTRSAYLPGSAPWQHRGMRVVVLPAAGGKHFEALSHSAAGVLAAVAGRHDIYHFHALGPGAFTPVARLSGGTTVLTVHGLDFQRAKWGNLAGKLLRGAERVAVRGARSVVVVAPDLVEHYRREYGLETTYIRNGVLAPARSSIRHAHDPYVLFVGRLTPEKGTDLLLRAFRRVEQPDVRLLVVGGSSHTDGFVSGLHETAAADPRVEFLGYRYGSELAELYAGARLFVQPSLLEGMPLTLLEAAVHGAPLLASDIPVHRELLRVPSAGRRMFRSGSADDLADRLNEALQADPAIERTAAREFGDSTLRNHSWDDVTDELETLYRELADRGSTPAGAAAAQEVAGT